MTIAFVNPSRSFDAVRRVVRFAGHDGMTEVPFTVDVAALTRAGQVDPSEASMLATFDKALDMIHNVAREAYANSRRTRYDLTAADFR